MRSEFSFSREGTCRRPSGLMTKSLKLQCCSRCSLPKMLSKTPAQKITEEARIEKTWSRVQETEGPLAVKDKDKDNLFIEHLSELLPLLHLLKQFDLKYDASFWSSRSFFLKEFLKTVTLSCIFSDFVGFFSHNVDLWLKFGI